MIVTIDGPAGAGKSCAARSLAKRLGYGFLDTGAMYRAATLEARQRVIDWNDAEAWARIAEEIDLKLTSDRIVMNGEDVTTAIRTFDITTHTRFAADSPAVRKRLVEMQQEIVAGRDFVTEGRDQATVVFRDAECKIFLTASDEVRAQRRYEDLIARGESISLNEVLRKQRERDDRDEHRKIGGLRKAPDSVEVCTDGLSPDEVVDQLETIVRSRQSS